MKLPNPLPYILVVLVLFGLLRLIGCFIVSESLDRLHNENVHYPYSTILSIKKDRQWVTPDCYIWNMATTSSGVPYATLHTWKKGENFTVHQGESFVSHTTNEAVITVKILEIVPERGELAMLYTKHP